MRTRNVSNRRVVFPSLSKIINLARFLLHQNLVTYMVCNVNDGGHNPVSNFGCHHKGKISLVNLDIDMKSRAKGDYLHVVSICTSTSHLSQMTLKSSVHFLRGSWNTGKGCGETFCILPLRISSRSPSRVNFNELLVIGTIISHVIDHGRTQLSMLGLVSKKLIRERIEETVAYSPDT